MIHKYIAPHRARIIYDVSGKLTEDFGPGPRHLKMAWVINLHKIISVFIVYGFGYYWASRDIDSNRAIVRMAGSYTTTLPRNWRPWSISLRTSTAPNQLRKNIS